MGNVGQELRDKLAPMLYADEQHGGSLAAFLDSVGVSLDEIDDMVRDGSEGQAGWSSLLDLDRIPTKALPWLAQFVGVSVVPKSPLETEDQYVARTKARILDTDGWKRGTPGAMKGAILPYLTGTKSIIFRERFGSPYHISIVTRAVETPDPAAVLAALIDQKPAGITLSYVALLGQDFQTLYENYASFQSVYTGYATLEKLMLDDISTPTNARVSSTRTIDFVLKSKVSKTLTLKYSLFASPTPGGSLPSRMSESVGTQYYVDPVNGDNTVGTGTFSNPWRGVSKALSSVGNGATINVRGGNITGLNTYLAKRFSGSNPVTIRAYQNETVTWTGSATTESGNAFQLEGCAGIRVRKIVVSAPLNVGLKVDTCDDIEIDSCFIINNGQQGILVVGNDAVTGAPVTYSRNVQIYNSTFTHNGGYFPGDEPYAQKGDHSIYMGGGLSGTTRHGCDGFVIANNLIYAQHTGYGIQVGQWGWNGFIVNNTIDECTQTGVDADRAGSAMNLYTQGGSTNQNVLIINNLFTNNVHHAVLGFSNVACPSNLVRNNLTYNNGSQPDYDAFQGYPQPAFTIQTNKTPANPLYINRASRNYKISSSSPAKGQAEAAYAPQFDHDGVPRPAAPSIGAFEP